MRIVKLITGVEIQEVPCSGDYVEFFGCSQDDLSYCYPTKEVLNTTVKKHIVPVKTWFQMKYKNNDYVPELKEIEIFEKDYIALSPEIDETLGKYINILLSEIRNEKYNTAVHYQEIGRLEEKLLDLKQKYEDLESSSIWNKLKWVFGIGSK